MTTGRTTYIFQRRDPYFALVRINPPRFEKCHIVFSVDRLAARLPFDRGPDGDGGIPIEEAA